MKSFYVYGLVGVICFVLLIFDFSPVMTLCVFLLYGFYFPASLLRQHLSRKFVGLGLTGKTIFLMPVFLPVWLVVFLPVWELDYCNTNIGYGMLKVLLAILVIVQILLTTRKDRPFVIEVSRFPRREIAFILVGALVGYVVGVIL